MAREEETKKHEKARAKAKAREIMNTVPEEYVHKAVFRYAVEFAENLNIVEIETEIKKNKIFSDNAKLLIIYRVVALLFGNQKAEKLLIEMLEKKKF